MNKLKDPNVGLQIELKELINRYSRENRSNTPDFILAEYLYHCLVAFENATNQRTGWYSGTSEETTNE